MRLRDLTRGHERDPLLKVGVGAMIVALGFAMVVVATSLDQPMKVAAAQTDAKSTTEPLVRSDPGVDPWVEKDILPPKPVAPVRAQAAPDPAPPPRPTGDSQPVSVPDSQPNSEPAPGSAQQPTSRPEQQQAQPANHPLRYHLPPGAIMSLSVPSIGLNQVPVLNSNARGALDRGVVHLPDTSLPWSDTPERNVYLAGHRLGWPGTGSHLVFYRLNELDGGEKITLRGGDGRTYDYKVLESFVVGPQEEWVTGRVKGRDLLTLQTCTPIPTFQWRLIVRAERS